MGPLQQGALLRHFLAVANERSVSAAARALAISQPALTRSIRRLEADYGVALFERLPRGMALTPFGEVLFRHAQRIATEIQFAEAEMDAFREGHAGRLRVGAGPFWGTTIVPVGIARMQERFPKLAVHLDVGVNAVILPKLFDGELDLVFGAIPEADAVPPFILRREFLANDIRVVASASHPLLQRSRVGAAGATQGARPLRGERREATQGGHIRARDLAPYAWVVYQQDRDVIVRLLAAMQAAGAAPPAIRVESTSMSALIRLLKAGPYLACVSEALINAQPDVGIRIVPVALEIWRFPTGMLLHRSLEHYAPARSLADCVYAEVGTLRQTPDASARVARR
jgi:DNA-binding transcriptional LysR family regulator